MLETSYSGIKLGITLTRLRIYQEITRLFEVGRLATLEQGGTYCDSHGKNVQWKP